MDIADPSSKLVTFSVAGVASKISFDCCGLGAVNDSKISFDCCVRTGLGAATLSISALALAMATSLPTSIAFHPTFATVLLSSTAFLPSSV